MKFFKSLLSAFIIVFTVQSCKIFEDKTVIQVPLTITTFEKLGSKNDKFPSFFEKLCDPFETSSEVKSNFAPYPIVVKRLDIPNGDVPLNIIADEKNSNTNSLSYRKNIVKKYFQDNSLGNVLTQDPAANVDKTNTINSYISSLSKKSKVFFFSTSAKNNTYNNSILYDDADSLTTAISKYLSEEGKSDIVIILNPEQSSPYRVDTTSSSSADTTSIRKSDADEIEQSKSETETLRQALLEISNPNLSFQVRKSNANKAINNLFTNNFDVVMHEGQASASKTVWEKGRGKNYLLERLTTDDSILGYQIINAWKSIKENKISHIELVEIHKVD